VYSDKMRITAGIRKIAFSAQLEVASEALRREGEQCVRQDCDQKGSAQREGSLRMKGNSLELKVTVVDKVSARKRISGVKGEEPLDRQTRNWLGAANERGQHLGAATLLAGGVDEKEYWDKRTTVEIVRKQRFKGVCQFEGRLNHNSKYARTYAGDPSRQF